MKNTNLIFSLLAIITVAALSTGCKPIPSSAPPTPVCETFDAMPLVQYNTPPPPPPAPNPSIFSVAGGVPVRIQNINLPSGAYFNFAGIEAAPASFGSGKVVNTNNVCLEFDFSGKNVKEASIEFQDMGGTENLWVNGAAYSGELTAASATLGGANVSVVSSPIPGGKTGKVTVKSTTGNINTLRIGGQEFHLDNLCYQ